MSVTATVTLPYSEFEEIQRLKREAEERAAKADEKISEARVRASDQNLLRLARAAVEVVRFAVASLPPESNRGWPFEAIRAIAAAIPLMPDATQDHIELAQTISTFAIECERHENRRAASPLVRAAEGFDPRLADGQQQ